MRPRHFFSINRVLLFSFLFLLNGCVQPVRTPIETIEYDAENVSGPRMLFVFLPGKGDSVTVFQKEGLIKAVRERGLPVDVIAVNAHEGYYLNGTVFTRIREDVIKPARARAYSQIWLIGNSLGGYGSLTYAREHPDEITGVVLLGPFLGRKSVIHDILEAGGLEKWKPGEIRMNTEDQWDKHLWMWVKDCVQQKDCFRNFYMGYGRDDRYSDAQALLASSMPSDHVIAIDGGHSWSTWKKLWLRFLGDKIFTVRTLPGAAHAVGAQ